MSRTSKSSSNSRTFCKVCFDSGKPISMHTSHNVRNDRGIVCCPTLKSVVCSYCGIKGHGPKYCTRLEKDKKEQLRAKPMKEAKPYKEPIKEKTVTKSTFAGLEMSSDSETEEDVKPVAVPVVAATKPAPWASTQPRVTKWSDLYDSADEDDEDN